ncbi:MAG TPA: hypothetical protein VGF99_10405 [Myxococcota bacterium]
MNLPSLVASAPPHHELLSAFAARGLTFNPTLHEMLNEHFSHHTERRGSGFTQATRHLAVLVNRPPELHHDATLKLFPELGRAARDALPPALCAVVAQMPQVLELEESRLFAAIVADVVQPIEATASLPALKPCFEPLKMGTCPLAEKYFLEIADGFVRPRGRVNVFVDDEGRPLLVEKLRLGDDHSCVNVQTLVLNGVRLPPGCLLGVKRDEDGLAARPNRRLPGEVIPVSRCEGFRFLRLTTLAVTPQNRQRAFTTHFKAQLDAGLYAPGKTTIEHIRRIAEEAV